ncbi:MAG: hypothetical protein ABI977_29700, partial [Acidobacteriota bacterium]
MQTKQLNQILFDVENGKRTRRLRKGEEALTRLRQEMVRLQEVAQTLREDFKVRLEAWTSQDVPGSPRPVAREEDLREARLATVGAVMLTVTELATAFSIALIFLVNPVALLLVALVGIFALKAGLLTLLRNDHQPQLQRRRLLRWVIAPSLTVTMLTLALLSFARLGGLLALLLLPLINIALCLFSLGALGLAAGLYSLAHQDRWSRHAERRYNAVEREAVETLRVLRQVEKIVAELRGEEGLSVGSAGNVGNGTNAAMPTGNSQNLLQWPAPNTPARSTAVAKVVARGGSFLSLIVLSVALAGSGCSLTGQAGAPAHASNDNGSAASSADPVSPSSAPSASGPAAPAADAVVMEIWLDWSLSTSAQAYRESAQTLINALPELAIKHDIVLIKAFQFGKDGWNAAEIFSLDLPLPQSATMDEASRIFTPLQKEQQQRAAERRAALVRERLRNLKPESLLPQQAIEPPCTDLRGALHRMSFDARPQRRLIYLVTDGHDTCSKKLPPIALARAALVVVL